MRRTLVALLAVLLPALVIAVDVSPARADATIESTSIENGYPKALTFHLSASAPVQITEVALRYNLKGAKFQSVAKPDPAAFVAGTSVNTTVVLETNPNGNWLPVGNDIAWHWEVTLADGTTTVGPESSYLYLPTGKDWQTAQNDIAVVYSTASQATLANQFLAAIQKTYDDHGKGLLKTDLPIKPIKLVVLSDSKAINEASPTNGKTLDNSQRVVVCGLRPGNFLPDQSTPIIFVAVACGPDAVDTVRHEFGHILNSAAGAGTLVPLPFWLDEGLAVYAQDKQDDYKAAFDAASRRQKLISFSDMGSAIGDQNQTILQYGEAYRMVKYLIDAYGQDELRALLATTKKNTRFDVALKATYGFDLAGFEKEFTASVSAGGSPTATPARQQSQPTQAPTTSPRQQPATQTTTATGKSSSSNDSGISRTTVIMVGVALILLLCAMLAFLVSMYMQNARSGPQT
jgi:hypothetical protein